MDITQEQVEKELKGTEYLGDEETEIDVWIPKDISESTEGGFWVGAQPLAFEMALENAAKVKILERKVETYKALARVMKEMADSKNELLSNLESKLEAFGIHELYDRR